MSFTTEGNRTTGEAVRIPTNSMQRKGPQANKNKRYQVKQMKYCKQCIFKGFESCDKKNKKLIHMDHLACPYGSIDDCKTKAEWSDCPLHQYEEEKYDAGAYIARVQQLDVEVEPVKDWYEQLCDDFGIKEEVSNDLDEKVDDSITPIDDFAARVRTLYMTKGHSSQAAEVCLTRARLWASSTGLNKKTGWMDACLEVIRKQHETHDPILTLRNRLIGYMRQFIAVQGLTWAATWVFRGLFFVYRLVKPFLFGRPRPKVLKLDTIEDFCCGERPALMAIEPGTGEFVQTSEIKCVPREYQVGFTFHGYRPWIPRGCGHNEQVAICARQLIKPVGHSEMRKEAFRIGREYVMERQPLPKSQLTWQEALPAFLEHFPANRRKGLQISLLSLWESEDECKTVSFVKVEFLVPKHPDKRHPRCIS